MDVCVLALEYARQFVSLRTMECREGGEREGKGERLMRRRRRRVASLLARIMCGRMCIVPGPGSVVRGWPFGWQG